MKKCPNCGTEMNDPDIFCTNCGQRYTAPATEDTTPVIEEPTNEAPAEEAEEPQSDTAAEEIISEAEQQMADEDTPYEDEQNEKEPEEQQEERTEEPETAKPAEPLIIGPDSAEQSTKQQDEKKARTAPAYQTANYNAITAPRKDPVRLGEWVLYLLVLAIPIVNIVMAFVWAFGSDTKPSLKNFARAWLIWAAVALVVIIVLTVLMITGLYSYASQYASQMPGNYYHYGF